MAGIRLGQVDYLNCKPVYHALEEGQLDFQGSIVKGSPTLLNRMFLEGKIDVTPISSIEYARHNESCVILPSISIGADGRVGSILLFSRYPVTELEGKSIAVTTSSATSTELLKILMEHYYHVDAQYFPQYPELKIMLQQRDAALLIGDDAMLAHRKVLEDGLDLNVTDLGEAWKNFSGEKMVYAIWVMKKDYAEQNSHEVDNLNKLLISSLNMGMSELGSIIKNAHLKTGLPFHVLEDYFQTISYNFDQEYRRSLIHFYDYAYKSGIIDNRIKLHVWSETGE